MASTPAVPAATGPSKLQTILGIIQITLVALGTVIPGTALAGTLLTIFQRAAVLYQQETGQPFDVTKIPYEQPVP